MADRPALSIVIPTLAAERTLVATLAALAPAHDIAHEVIVSDGGSADATVAIARAHGAQVIARARARGPQLRVGAAAARGTWLLFLHADTVLGPAWRGCVRAFMGDAANAERAATFRLILDSPRPAARRIERLAAWRARRLGLPYGDQGLLIARTFYDALGGYADLALMEDVDLVRRIGRDRLRTLECPATTAAERYERGGYWRRPLANLCCLGLYFAGLPPRWLARLYG